MNNLPNRRLTFSTLILALLCCCAAMMFSSCSKKASNLIVGKWQVQSDNKGGTSIVEFKSDGTMINSEGGGTQNGKYTFSDDTHMKMEMTLPKGDDPAGATATAPASITVDCVVKINGDDLDMEMAAIMPGDPQAQSHKQTVHMKRIK
jgi:hypothetical protein